MSKHLTYVVVSLFLVVIVAAQTANAQSISVELAERTPPVDPGDLIPPTTTTTTTTLPTIPRCPDSIAGAHTGSQSGYTYWAWSSQDFEDMCHANNGTDTIYCFENPYVQQTLLEKQNWKMVTQEIDGASQWQDDTGAHSWYTYTGTWDVWDVFAAEVTRREAYHPEACYTCGCFRADGCFPPGVKITMTDGSLRNIEDVRAGDLVRNAKTGAPVKVSKVIEGPEALPLIRFGFEGTTVTTSQAHPVLTAAGLKAANQLKKGDTVFDAQGSPHSLTVLETLPLEEGQRVINVNLDAASSDVNERLLISDGIITGDIVLQGLLKERK